MLPPRTIDRIILLAPAMPWYYDLRPALKATRGGRLRWRYRFSRSAAGRTFAFRVRVDSPIYPFAPGNSRTMLVRVR